MVRFRLWPKMLYVTILELSIKNAITFNCVIICLFGYLCVFKVHIIVVCYIFKHRNSSFEGTKLLRHFMADTPCRPC